MQIEGNAVRASRTTLAAVSSFHTDVSLLERCREGDAAAWEALVARYRRLVWSIILKYRLSDESREDVFQQVFTALVQHIDDVREEGALASWLSTTAKRVCWRVTARAARDVTRTASLHANPEQSIDPPMIEHEAAAFESLDERQRVRTGLERLGGKCRDLLEALFGATGEPNYIVIAEKLGIRVGSIGPTRARCLEKLADVLQTLGFSAPGAKK